ncbi:MAG: SUMF1/EgtB/PvdO family nonheme iron enzyme [Cyanobacteria bacterium J06639_14]
MVKVALLIGISEYGEGLSDLPGTQEDLQVMQRVLKNPQIGDFDTVSVLHNPNRTDMERAIEMLFAEERRRDDLVLLYFSGHGVKDDEGTLYFATTITEKNSRGDILISTTVRASALQYYMNQGRSKRQVLILDCCFSGAFAQDMKAKSDVSIDVKEQLGGEGRVVLTSSRATQVSYEKEGASIYTRYLVKGLETGAADRDKNGLITADELHEYTKNKVQEVSHNMQPEIYAVREGYKIIIARSPQKNANLPTPSKVSERTKTRQTELSQSIKELLKEPLILPELSGTEKFEFKVIVIDNKGEEIIHCQRYSQCFIERIENITIEMVVIPGGTFLMGSPKKHASLNELPTHLVKVKPFLMSKFPITKSQWRAIASLPKIHCDLQFRPSRKGSKLHPVVNVSWYDAMEFCARLSKKSGQKYRLPNEAEWEYACRAYTETPFYFGQTITSDLANYDGTHIYHSEPKGIMRNQTTTVGNFSFANFFGLFDMHGNVWEWCMDNWHEDYQGAPDDGIAWLDSDDSQIRVLRGGSWVNAPMFCRSTSRISDISDNNSENVGFRVVRML